MTDQPDITVPHPELVQHLEGCPKPPRRVEPIRHPGMTVTRCLECGQQWPSPPSRVGPLANRPEEPELMRSIDDVA